MSKEILELCPFCGGGAYVSSTFNIATAVICNECGAAGTAYSGKDSKEKAIKAWNTRKPIERMVERLDEVRKEIIRLDSDNHYLYKDGADYMADRAIEIVKAGGADETD